MLKIQFTTSNAAFADGNGMAECAHILRDLAASIEGRGGRNHSGKVRDSNGNNIGEWSLSIDADQEGGE